MRKGNAKGFNLLNNIGAYGAFIQFRDSCYPLRFFSKGIAGEFSNVSGDFRFTPFKGYFKTNNDEGVLGRFVNGVRKIFKASRREEVGITQDKDFGLRKKTLKGELVIEVFSEPVIAPWSVDEPEGGSEKSPEDEPDA